MPPPPKPPHVSSSAISAFIEPSRIEALLEPLIPDAHDRAFIVRCVVGEGPAHHRGANYVLLALLGKVLEKQGLPMRAPSGESYAVPMRIPPHLADAASPPEYALALPLAPLQALTGANEKQLAAMIDCITDGPPQHALANVAMVAMLGRLLEGHAGEEGR